MNAATLAAHERRLDWLLDEVLGDAHGEARRGAAPATSRWIAAALVVLAVSAAFGVAWLRRDEAAKFSQEPAKEIPWLEVHGPDALVAVPEDAIALKCFDFDDDALRALPKFQKLEHLDLAGMDVNEKGYSVSLKITDLGVVHVSKLLRLRSLSLASCHEVKGTSLHVLEGLPLLERLDLTSSGVESAALERLPLLGSLRELTLSHCMNFHGRSLAEVAKIPGLRKLELQACTTVAAKDALHLANAKGLRHLDLRDCQGRFRGQRGGAEGWLKAANELLGSSPPPVEDDVGITDDVVAAIAALPLETLLLGGSESLTDAIGDSLAKMTTLRTLDLSNLPKTTGAMLAKVPAGLEHLSIGDNGQFTAEALARLPHLGTVRTLDISGLDLDEFTLRRLLVATSLRALHLGGRPARGKGDRPPAFPPLPTSCAALIAEQKNLESLDVRDAAFVDRAFLTTIATLPRLRDLDLTGPLMKPPLDRSDTIRGLAGNRSLQSLKLTWNGVDATSLAELRGLPLRELDLYGTNLTDSAVRAVAASWPGFVVKMPGGQRYVVPATR